MADYRIGTTTSDSMAYANSVQHGDLATLAFGDLDAYVAKDRLAPCRNCPHIQFDHDSDERCLLCRCAEFEYEEDQ